MKNVDINEQMKSLQNKLDEIEGLIPKLGMDPFLTGRDGIIEHCTLCTIAVALNDHFRNDSNVDFAQIDQDFVRSIAVNFRTGI